jgi:addiction module HigA family antidote
MILRSDIDLDNSAFTGRALSAAPNWSSIMVSAQSPVHPGEILSGELLKPAGITQSCVARRIRVAPRRINEIAHGRRAILPETALRLARALGTSDRFWVNLQRR